MVRTCRTPAAPPGDRPSPRCTAPGLPCQKCVHWSMMCVEIQSARSIRYSWMQPFKRSSQNTKSAAQKNTSSSPSARWTNRWRLVWLRPYPPEEPRYPPSLCRTSIGLFAARDRWNRCATERTLRSPQTALWVEGVLRRSRPFPPRGIVPCLPPSRARSWR